MARRSKNQHNWTYLPELGPDWEYCEICDLCRHVQAPEHLFTYKQALTVVQAPPAAKAPRLTKKVYTKPDIREIPVWSEQDPEEWSPEFYRLRGEMILQGEPVDILNPENWFHEKLDKP